MNQLGGTKCWEKSLSRAIWGGILVRTGKKGARMPFPKGPRGLYIHAESNEWNSF